MGSPQSPNGNFLVDKGAYRVQLLMQDERYNRPEACWELIIDPKYKASIEKRIPGSKWGPAINTWRIPFSGAWTNINHLMDALDECVEKPKPKAPPQRPEKRASPLHKPSWTQQPHRNPSRAAHAISVRASPAPASTSTNLKRGWPYDPADYTKNKRMFEDRQPDAPNAQQWRVPRGIKDVEVVDMEYEPRTISEECTTYATFKIEHLMDSDVVVALHVDERKFKEGVLCVTISGKVAEVEAYFAGRYIAAHNVAQYRELHHFENKHRSFGARVIAEFIV